MTPLRLGLTLLLAASLPAAAADLSYRVTNGSDMTIMEIYASPTGEDSWGQDLLHVNVLPQGGAETFVIPDGASRCDYDLRFIFENGHELVEAANICASPIFTARRTP